MCVIKFQYISTQKLRGYLQPDITSDFNDPCEISLRTLRINSCTDISKCRHNMNCRALIR